MTKLKPLVAVAAATLAFGCGSKKQEDTKTEASGSAEPKAVEKPKTPEVKPSAMCGDAKSPDWMKAIPAAPPKAKVGDKVWAIALDDDNVTMRTFKVDAIDGSTVTVGREGDDEKIKTCGSLVFPYVGPSKLKPGELAMVEGAASGRVMSAVRVDKIDGDSITVKHWLVDKVGESTVSSAQPLGTAVEPLGYVAYKRDGNVGIATGYVLAVVGDKAFVLNTEFKAVDNKPTSELHVARPCPKEFAVGDAVTALDSQRSESKGKVTKVVEPLLYEVDFGGKTDKYDCPRLADTKALGL